MLRAQGFKGGPLKDGADWAKVGLKANHKVMLIGTAGEIVAPPTAEELKVGPLQVCMHGRHAATQFCTDTAFVISSRRRRRKQRRRSKSRLVSTIWATLAT